MVNKTIAERFVLDLLRADTTPIGETPFTLWRSTLGFHASNLPPETKPFRRLDEAESATVKHMLDNGVLVTTGEACEPSPGVMGMRIVLNEDMPLMDIARYIAATS
jgi:hypothetical protein